jgi:hypothetical protein
VGKKEVGKKIEGRMRHIVTDTEGPPAAAGTSQAVGGMQPPRTNRALPLPRSLFGGSNPGRRSDPNG